MTHVVETPTFYSNNWANSCLFPHPEAPDECKSVILSLSSDSGLYSLLRETSGSLNASQCSLESLCVRLLFFSVNDVMTTLRV